MEAVELMDDLSRSVSSIAVVAATTARTTWL